MPEVRFLSWRLAEEWYHVHRTLLEVLKDVAALWPTKTLTVTCIHRTRAEEAAAGGKSGIHTTGPPHRAIDLRIKDIPNYQVEADKIAVAVNAKWKYDDRRQELNVAVSKLHGSGPHLHLQTSDATKRVS